MSMVKQHCLAPLWSNNQFGHIYILIKQPVWTQLSIVVEQQIRSHIYLGQTTRFGSSKSTLVEQPVRSHISWPNNVFEPNKVLWSNNQFGHIYIYIYIFGSNNVLWLSNQLSHIYSGQTTRLDPAKYFGRVSSSVTHILHKEPVWTQQSTLVEQPVRPHIYFGQTIHLDPTMYFSRVTRSVTYIF